MDGDDKFQRGVSLFNCGEFFSAHEIWEELWLTESEPEKTFLQGLIQAAAAFHHFTRGNVDGMQSLLAAAAVKLRRSPPEYRSIDVARLREDIVFWARELGRGHNPGRDKLPRIAAVAHRQ